MVTLHQSTALLFVRSSPILYTSMVPATATYAEMRNSGWPSLPVWCGRPAEHIVADQVRREIRERRGHYLIHRVRIPRFPRWFANCDSQSVPYLDRRRVVLSCRMHLSRRLGPCQK